MEAIRSAFSVHTMGVLKGQFCLFGSQQEVDDYDREVERIERERRTAIVEAALTECLTETGGCSAVTFDEHTGRWRCDMELTNPEILAYIAEDMERIMTENGEPAAWEFMYDTLERNGRESENAARKWIIEEFAGWLEDMAEFDDFKFVGLEYDDEMLRTVIDKLVYFSYEELKDDVLSYTTIEAA